MEPLLALLGGLAPLLLFRLLGARHYHAGELMMGALLFIAVLIVQPLLQLAPLLYYGVSPEAAASGGAAILVAVYFGLVAAVVQSSLKYLFVRGMSASRALSLGLGFGIAEAIYVALSAYIVGVIINAPIGEEASRALEEIIRGRDLELGLWGLPLIAAERFAAATFHGASALLLVSFIAAGRGLSGLLALVAIHGLIDTLAMLINLGILRGVAPLLLLELLALLIALSLAALYGRQLSRESPEAPLY